MAYQSWSVSMAEQPSASKWNILGLNDASFNDGTGYTTNALQAASFKTNAFTLGYAEATSDQTVNSAEGTKDLTGLSVAVTIPAGGRRCKITGFIPYIAGSTGANACWLFIREGGTVLSACRSNVAASSADGPLIAVYSAILTAGSHTYKLSMSADAADAVTFDMGTDHPGFILVEAI